MKKRMFIAVLLIGASPDALAVHGAWSSKVAGPQLSVGKQIYAGPPQRPASPLPQHAVIRRINWRITLLSPLPPGLEIKLCSARACIKLDRLVGQRATPLPFTPGETLRFIYSVNVYGQLRPPVQVISSQVTVNYLW